MFFFKDPAGKTYYWVFAGLGIMLLLFCALPCCQTRESSLDKILEQGRITMITDNSAHGYYIYREQPMGFEYDLAKEFAGFLDVELKVMTPGWDEIFTAIESGRGDFIASSLTKTDERQDRLDFSNEYMAVQQQVVVRKGNYAIDEVADLEGKTVHIRSRTSYHERLRELKEEGFDIRIKLYENTPTEEFLRRVQEGEIELTVADSNIIRLNRRYYPDIFPAFPISEKQSLCWAVKEGDKKLQKKINDFFAHIRENGTYAKIYNRYYTGTDIFDYVDTKKFHLRLKTRLPKYRETIIEVSEEHNFDWRLIAALIYQESHFNPIARSYTGAIGLMQLTKVTAEEVGVENRSNPGASIKGGVKYLKLLYNRFEEIDSPDRIKFTLASYNVGYGHVRDAQDLARRQKLDPCSWKTMERVLPLLRYPKYYEKTKYGYARGTEPVRYVKRIFRYYDILKVKTALGMDEYAGFPPSRPESPNI